MPDILYLHGFASGPTSHKGAFFARQFAQIGATVHQPDLNEGDFRGLTIQRQTATAARLVRELRPELVIGSSMGGYVAALCATVEPLTPPLVLLAPAFRFAERWAERLGPEKMAEWQQAGETSVYHYGEGRFRPIGYQLYEDALWFAAFPDVQQPTLVFHGRRDDVVGPEESVRFAWGRPHVQLELLDSDHGLTDVLDTIWKETVAWRLRLPSRS